MNDGLRSMEDETARRKAETARARQDFSLCFQGETGERCLRWLETRFETHLPAFRTPELAEFPPGNCTTMAAIRDGQREVIALIRAMANH